MRLLALVSVLALFATAFTAFFQLDLLLARWLADRRRRRERGGWIR